MHFSFSKPVFNQVSDPVHHEKSCTSCLQKGAPSAHVSRFGRCTNGVQYGVGLTGADLYSGDHVPLSANNQRRYCVMCISSSLFTWPRKYTRPQTKATAASPSAIHPCV